MRVAFVSLWPIEANATAAAGRRFESFQVVFRWPGLSSSLSESVPLDIVILTADQWSGFWDGDGIDRVGRQCAPMKRSRDRREIPRAASDPPGQVSGWWAGSGQQLPARQRKPAVARYSPVEANCVILDSPQ